MSFISIVAPNGAAGGPLPGALAQAAALASAVAVSKPTAQLLLPTAIVATPTLTPKQADPGKAPKTAARSLNLQPSSGFAAQLMAQTGEISPQELALFAPRAPVTPQPTPPALPQLEEPIFAAPNFTLPPAPMAPTAEKLTAQSATILPFLVRELAADVPQPQPVKRPAQVNRALSAYGKTEASNALKRSEHAFDSI